MKPYGDPPSDVPAFVFWPMPDEDPTYEDWPNSSPLRAWQRGRCAMCQVSDWFDNALVMDHDHDTGKIRGLLCHGCNVSEPHNFSPRFVAWRAGLTPAWALGIDEEYQYWSLGHKMIEEAMRQPVSDADLDAIADAMAYGRLPGE